MNTVCILICMILIVMFYLKTMTDSHLWFCIYIFIASLGNYYNELYQFANGIVIADLALALFVISYIIAHRKNLHIHRKTAYIYMLAVYMLLLGLLNGSEFGQILRDIKVFLYFFSAFLYCEKYKDNVYFVRYIKNTLLICICFTIIVCANTFLNYGLQGVATTGKIDRIFGMGLSEYGLAIFVMILLAIGKTITSHLEKILLWGLIVLCIGLSIVSYTRSIWIQLLLSMVSYFIVRLCVIKHEISFSTLIKSMTVLLSCVAITLFIVNYLRTDHPDLYNVLESRMLSIQDIGTGNQGVNVDTILFRLNDIRRYSEKFYNPRILFGWGFGDKLKGANSGIVENSFLYYSWKYGIVLFCVLIAKLYGRFKKLVNSRSEINIAVLCSLFAYLISGGISGHLNKYYYLPLVAILLSIDFGQYFENNSNSRLSRKER